MAGAEIREWADAEILEWRGQKSGNGGAELGAGGAIIVQMSTRLATG